MQYRKKAWKSAFVWKLKTKHHGLEISTHPILVTCHFIFIYCFPHSGNKIMQCRTNDLLWFQEEPKNKHGFEWCEINKSMWNHPELNAKKVLTSAQVNARPLSNIKTHCIHLHLLWKVVKFSDEQFCQRERRQKTHNKILIYLIYQKTHIYAKMGGGREREREREKDNSA